VTTENIEISSTEHKAHKKVERIGGERALIRAHNKKRKWIEHTLEGDSLLRIVIEKENDDVLDAGICIWKA